MKRGMTGARRRVIGLSRTMIYDSIGFFSFNYFIEDISEILPRYKTIIMDKLLYNREDYKFVDCFDISYDMDRASNLSVYDDIEGTAMEKYIGCILLEYFEKFDGAQQIYIHKLEKKAVLNIEMFYLDCLYNPRTKLGVKRFNKEFDKLIHE